MTNTINTQKANEIRIPTNGNCKKVKNLTTGAEYGSITEAAILLEVTGQAVSTAIKNKHLCKGCRLMLVKDLHDNIEDICDESAKANRRAEKAEARLVKVKAKEEKNKSEMAELRAKADLWDAYIAEQEAKRKEETKRLEAERKEEEKRQAKLTKLENKIERLETLIDRERDKAQKLVDKRNKALDELKALMNGKEVV